jgi:tRNA (guanine-N7-)-methyltransferase
LIAKGDDEATENAQSRVARTHSSEIRSYVLRQGRVSNAQARHYESDMPRWGIPYTSSMLDLGVCFGRVAPKILEIGFGMGETTAATAALHPGNDYLGIEVHTPGVGSLLKEIATRELTNIRIVQHDAGEVLRDMIAPASLSAALVFFPDPWPKKRHHKRRLLQPSFVHLLASRLVAGGRVHCATDWEEYASEMLAVLSSESLLENTAGTDSGYAARPDARPQTKFETRGLKLGHGVWDLIFQRRGEAA